MEYVYDGILYHDGQKGMHWGVRKYRNYDGTLTPAGKERYNYGDGSSGSFSSPKISRREARKQRKLESARQAKKESEKAAKEAKEALENLKREREAFEKAQKEEAVKNQQERIAAQKLSNEELRASIERMNLERQYNELVNPKAPPKESFTKRLSQFAKDITPIIGAGAAAYKLYKDIKGNDADDKSSDAKTESKQTAKSEKKEEAKKESKSESKTESAKSSERKSDWSTPEMYNPANQYSSRKQERSSWANNPDKVLALPAPNRANTYTREATIRRDSFFKERGNSPVAAYYKNQRTERSEKLNSWYKDWSDKKVETTFAPQLALPAGRDDKYKYPWSN